MPERGYANGMLATAAENPADREALLAEAVTKMWPFRAGGPLLPSPATMMKAPAAVKALPGMIASLPGALWQDIQSGFTLPGDVWAGKVDPTSEEGIGRATNLASTLMGGGMPAAKKGAAGIFGGRLSRTADLQALEEAKRMHAGGVSPEGVLSATGWMYGRGGPTGPWMYEMSDVPAQIKGTFQRSGIDPQTLNEMYVGMTRRGGRNRAMRLGEGLEHPELYAAYPELAEGAYAPGYHVGPTSPRKGVMAERDVLAGSFSPVTRDIEISSWGKTPTLAKKSLKQGTLHEVQHAIQKLEGFAEGSSPQFFSGHEMARGRQLIDAAKAVQVITKQTNDPQKIEHLVQLAAQAIGGKTPENADLIRRMIKEFSYEDLQIGGEMLHPYSNYFRQAGEVQARNVENRMDIPASQLRTKPPWDPKYTDVPFEQQLMHNKPASLAAPLKQLLGL